MSKVRFFSAVFVAVAAAGMYRAMHPTRHFEASEIPELAGKVAVVTGANTGIGLETTFELARKGAHVVMGCRSEKRARAAMDVLRARDASLSLEFIPLNLANLASVEQFATSFTAAHASLDIFVANAGVMATPFRLSDDGIELQFAVNHVGHFLLAHRLLPALAAADEARVVMVSSVAHKFTVPNGTFSEDVVNDDTSYSPFRAYGRSKLANIQFTRALADRLRHTSIRANAIHPGYVRTELMRNLQDVFGAWINPLLPFVQKFALSPQDGALTQLFAAASPEISNNDIRGRYFVPIAVEATPTMLATDENQAEQLWVLTTDMLAARGHKVDSVSALVGSK